MSNIKRKKSKFLKNDKLVSILVPIFSILLSLVVASIIIIALGKNPIATFASMLRGAGILPKDGYAAHKNIFTDLMETFNAFTPMIFAAIGVAVAMKAGLFNIGISGQMLLAGFVATITVGYSNLPAIMAKPLVILVGAVTGAFVGGLIGFLKYRFNINEVVSSIMLNYIIQYTTSYFINTKYVDAVSRQSKIVSPAARLTLVDISIGNLKVNLPICIVLALILVFIIKFFIDKTKTGYEIKSVGLNPHASEYAGINVGQNIMLSLVISGAFAGLAGVTYYMGYYNSMRPGVLANLGYDSIAVALLGNNNPIGIIFSSFLITVIDRGKTTMNSQMKIQQEISSLITGIILLFSACSGYINYLIDKKRLEEDK